MKGDIQEYVERYLHCQVSKIKQIKNPGLLQQLKILNSNFELINISNISHFNIQSWYTSIFMIVYQLIKMVLFIPTMTTLITYGIVNLFIKMSLKFMDRH